MAQSVCSASCMKLNRILQAEEDIALEVDDSTASLYCVCQAELKCKQKKTLYPTEMTCASRRGHCTGGR